MINTAFSLTDVYRGSFNAPNMSPAERAKTEAGHRFAVTSDT